MKQNCKGNPREILSKSPTCKPENRVTTQAADYSSHHVARQPVSETPS